MRCPRHLRLSLKTLPWKSPLSPLIVTLLSARPRAMAKLASANAPTRTTAMSARKSFLVLTSPPLPCSLGLTTEPAAPPYGRSTPPCNSGRPIGFAAPDPGQGQHPDDSVPNRDGGADRGQHRGLRLAAHPVLRSELEHLPADRRSLAER